MNQLFSRLDAFATPISLDVLLDWIQTTTISAADVERFTQFHPNRYQRNLMHGRDVYHALVLCWKAGQRSPIHDHSGSCCAVRVLRGRATETQFERAPNGMIYPTHSRILEVNETCVSEDSDIHQISNLQDRNADLVTLHIYSPPLLCMNVYSLLDPAVQQFIDPINDEFVGGSGI